MPGRVPKGTINDDVIVAVPPTAIFTLVHVLLAGTPAIVSVTSEAGIVSGGDVVLVKSVTESAMSISVLQVFVIVTSVPDAVVPGASWPNVIVEELRDTPVHVP